MTTQDTSRAAFDHLVANGLLLGKQLRIMELLVMLGAATSGEVLAKIRGVKNVNAWRGRFTELQQRGLIREVCTRRCTVSGRTCIVWAPTGRDKPLDEERGKGQPKRGRWYACAAQLARVVDDLRRLEEAETRKDRQVGIVGQNAANTAHLRAEASRALAEYTRLGGTVPA